MTRSTRRHLLTLAAALAVGTLGAHALPAAAQTPDEIRQKGTLTVGLLVDFPPYGTVDTSNQPDGYDADVAKLLARDWGVKLTLVPVNGPNRIPFLMTGKVDLLVASLAVTPERAKQVQFSKPYSAATIVLYGAKKLAVKAPADLKGVRVGVARASTQDVSLTQIAPEGTEIRRFDDDASAMQALMAGQVDAIGCSTMVAAQIAKRAGDAFEQKLVLRQQTMAVAMRPGQDALLKAVDGFIERRTADGELNKLYRKWLQTDLPAMAAAEPAAR